MATAVGDDEGATVLIADAAPGKIVCTTGTMTRSAITTAATMPARLSERARRYGAESIGIGTTGRYDAGVIAVARTAVASIA